MADRKAFTKLKTKLGKRASFLSVPIADSSLVLVEQIDLNRLEKLFTMIKSLKLTYTKDLA